MINKKLVTPYSEAFQAVIWHCLVSHPKHRKSKLNGKLMIEKLKLKF